LLALKIREELGDKRGLMNSYTNFGNIFNYDNNATEALKTISQLSKLAKS